MSKSNYLEDSSEFYDVDVEDTEEKSEEENLQEKIMSGEIKESDLVEYRSLDLDGLDLSGQDILADEEDAQCGIRSGSLSTMRIVWCMMFWKRKVKLLI